MYIQINHKDLYLLYILKLSDKSYYTGITNNLKRRLETHKKGKGSKYVKSRLPFKLVYTEICGTKSLALKREARIKKLTHKQKMILIGDSND